MEVLVFEEDTWRVLSAGNHIREIREPLAELEAQAVTQQADTLGSLVVRGQRWSMILHDFDRSASFVQDTVDDVLEKIALTVEAEGVTSIGIQAPGHFHGPMSLEESVFKIREQSWPECLRQIWVITPAP